MFRPFQTMFRNSLTIWRCLVCSARTPLFLGSKMLQGVHYEEINDKGLIVLRNKERAQLDCDNIVVYAGQIEDDSIYKSFIHQNNGSNCHIIGGAKQAGELDAQKAFAEGWELGMRI